MIARREHGRAEVAAVASLAALIGLGCRSPSRPPGPVASALLGVAADLGGDPQAIANAWLELQRIAARVESHHRETRGDEAADVNAVVFGALGFEREIIDDDPRFFELQAVVTSRRGTCLGLSDLYLALGERLGMPLDGILLPGHFFVRASGPGPERRNIELLRRGEAMPDDWYRNKYGPWPEPSAERTPGGAANSAYFRPLSTAELVGVHWYNAGNHHRRTGDVAAAERAYERAIAAFPTLAEAHASLGSLRQLRGALGDAEAAYREAARLRADLPGLEHNRELLDRERQRGSTPDTSTEEHTP